MARTKAHYHERHETAIYIIQGETGVWFGENLENYLVAVAGDYFYIPAGISHVAANLSDSEPALTLIARTDPNEQESAMLQPELDALVS